MKKLLPFLCIAIFTLANIELFAQTTTVSVGDGEYYPTLQAAFQAVRSGTLTGDIEMHIISDINETESSNIIAPGSFNTDYNSITVRPSGGQRTISYNAPFALISMYDAVNVTFDGRIGGTGDEVSLTIVNSGGGIFDMNNNTSNVAIRYLNLKGGVANAGNGVIKIGGAFRYSN